MTQTTGSLLGVPRACPLALALEHKVDKDLGVGPVRLCV